MFYSVPGEKLHAPVDALNASGLYATSLAREVLTWLPDVTGIAVVHPREIVDGMVYALRIPCATPLDSHPRYAKGRARARCAAGNFAMEDEVEACRIVM